MHWIAYSNPAAVPQEESQADGSFTKSLGLPLFRKRKADHTGSVISAPSSHRPPSRLRRDLRRIFAEGVAWSVMVGIGETYFPAFALALGMGEVGAGLIASIPLLAGGLLQLVTPHGVTRLGSRRRWATRVRDLTITFLFHRRPPRPLSGYDRPVG
jgi:hypothetical protein